MQSPGRGMHTSSRRQTCLRSERERACGLHEASVVLGGRDAFSRSRPQRRNSNKTSNEAMAEFEAWGAAQQRKRNIRNKKIDCSRARQPSRNSHLFECVEAQLGVGTVPGRFCSTLAGKCDRVRASEGDKRNILVAQGACSDLRGDAQGSLDNFEVKIGLIRAHIWRDTV